MKTKFFLLLLLGFGVNMVFAQGENDNWYFGNRGAVNFTSQTPVSIGTSNMNTMEACGSVSDGNGALLFYMNGEQIWNRQNQVMPNGTLIAPYQNDSAQQLAIVKNPQNPKQYYVFTTGENTFTQYIISYSIVDMSLGAIGNNGQPLGDVVANAKNIPVLNNTGSQFYSEAITVVPNASDLSYWVLIPNGTKLYSYKISNQGFSNGNPVVSDLNFPINLNQHKYYSVKSSPKIPNNNNSNYSHYICVSYWQNSSDPNPAFSNKVYSFNSFTGQITSDYSLQVNGLKAYVPEFNKNASVLFLGFRNIHAVDLVNSTSSNVQHMEIYHPAADPSFEGLAIQRNKYGDIYVSKPDNIYLGKILNPDVYSSAMGVNMDALLLLNGGTRYGLPQLVESVYDTAPYYPCISNLTLSSPELNNNFTYNVAHDIKTINNYIIGNDKRIVMNAENSITLLPNTTINAERFIAKIVRCDRGSVDKVSRENKSPEPIKMVLELDKEERMQHKNTVELFPNPATDILSIKTSVKIEEAEIFDISGKKVNVTLNRNTVDVRSLPSGSYMIRIKTETGVITKQFIKK